MEYWNDGMMEWWINEESPGNTSDLIRNIKPLYLRIDDQCVQNGGRTRLQELLLEDYAALNRLKLKAEYLQIVSPKAST